MVGGARPACGALAVPATHMALVLCIRSVPGEVGPRTTHLGAIKCT